MVRRKELFGVSAAIACWFLCRNNDLEGYWAPGVLYKAAYESGYFEIKLNLLSKSASPSLDQATKSARHLNTFLLDQLIKRGVPESLVQEATIKIKFNTPPTQDHIIMLASSAKKERAPDGKWLINPVYITHGEPFSCVVALKDDRQKIYKFQSIGVCRKHDPQLEIRSLR